MFADDICVFSPSVSGLQCLLNIFGDYAAEHEITWLQRNKWCTCTIFRPSEISGVWINASLKDDDDIQRQVKSPYCAANKFKRHFW